MTILGTWVYGYTLYLAYKSTACDVSVVAHEISSIYGESAFLRELIAKTNRSKC